MKRMMIMAIVAVTLSTGLMVSTSEAQLLRRNNNRRIFRGRYIQRPAGNFFDRFMEFERRKNAWLFGR